jgi:Arc/MetJ-type ribon-helix-helix transcriptional regulator
MTVTLSLEDSRFTEERVKAGEFRSVEEVVAIALAQLRSAWAGEFAPGELDALVAEGEADIKRGNVIDDDEVFRQLAEKSAAFRRSEQFRR